MTSKINDIIKVVAVCLIALVVVGCKDMEPMEPMMPSFDIPNTPEYGVIDKPKKTITIKRKKPTILNPSPRPLSEDYISEIEEDNYDEEYE